MKRRIMCVVIALCILQGVLPSTPASAATRYETGVSVSGSIVGMGRSTLQSRLDDIKQMGATWIRVDFSWPTIQPFGPGHYDWRGYDYLVHQASARNLKILAVLAYTPQWAQDPTCAALVSDLAAATKCSPDSPEDFARFASAVAGRYKHDRIRGYELWNEPNLLSYWRTVQGEQLSVDPAAFARYANAAATEIRKHNSDCVILPGGLAPQFESNPARGMRQSDFLTRLLPHLQKDLFTGIAIHPYSWPALPDTPAPYNAFYTVDGGEPEHNLRVIMQQGGWGDKEIWATEFGASTQGEYQGEPTGDLRPDHVSEPRQAEILKNGFDNWYIKENTGPLFVHSDSDTWLGTHKNESGFGLRRADGSAKPSYHVFKEESDIMNLTGDN